MASKVVSQGYPIYEGSTGLYTSKEIGRSMSGASSICMDADSVVLLLKDPSSNRRAAALDQLFELVRHSPNGTLPASDHVSLFQSLALALRDPDMEVKRRALNVLSELTSREATEIDDNMLEVLPDLVPCLGDSTVTVRRAATQCLHTYMKHTTDFANVINAIVRFGLETEEVTVQRDTCVSVPLLLTPDLASHDFFGIVQSLTKKLLANEEIVVNAALKALESVRGLIGEAKFTSYVTRLSPALQRYYYRVTGHPQPDTKSPAKAPTTSAATTLSVLEAAPKDGRSPELARRDPLSGQMNARDLKFGIVPASIVSQLVDTEDFRSRAQAVDELKVAVVEGDIRQTLPHLSSFLAFLLGLLDDSNFKITTVTLEVLTYLVDRLGSVVEPHFRPIVLALSRRLGDNKIVVRQAVMRLALLLMQNVRPQPVLDAICDNLRNRISRVRQETLNITICALLTFPSTDFDQTTLCQLVAPCLTDQKRIVRHAALECMAVLAQSLGAGNLQPIVDAVEASADQQDGNDLLKAVQARLARRQLPRRTADGLIEYSSPVPTSATHRRPGGAGLADSELVLAASSSAGSARARPAELVDLEAPADGAAVAGLERRRVSAGKMSKTRLPWEQEDASNLSTPARSRAESPNLNGGTAQPFSKAPDVLPLKPRGPPSQEEHVYALTARKADSKRVRDLYAGTPPPLTSSQSVPTSSRGSPQAMDPDPAAFRPVHIGRGRSQRKLEPINGTAGVASSYAFLAQQQPAPSSSSPQQSGPPQGDIESVPSCPIPTRPTLVRSAGKRRGTAPLVPPIPLSGPGEREETDSGIQSGLTSATRRGSEQGAPGMTPESFGPAPRRWNSASTNVSSPTVSDEEGEMYGSLATIRSSASRKKAMRVFEEAERRASGSFAKPPAPAARSSKPPPPQAGADAVVNRNGAPESSPSSKYSPYSGASFKENPYYDGKIIGRRMGDENFGPGSPLIATAAPPQPIPIPWDEQPAVAGATSSSPPRAKERRKPQPIKGSVSLYALATFDPVGGFIGHDTPPHSPCGDADHFNVVGKGVFEVGRPEEDKASSSTAAAKTSNRRGSKSEAPGSNPPAGIVGIGLEKTPSLSEDEETNIPDGPAKPTMSKTFQESLAQKKRQQQIEAEQRRMTQSLSRESLLAPSSLDSQRDTPDECLREKERERVRRQNASTGNLAFEVGSGNGPVSNSKPPAGSSTPKRPRARNSDLGMKSPGSGSAHSLSSSGLGDSSSNLGVEDPETAGPIASPDKALNEALRLVGTSDWQAKCQGLALIRRLCFHHKDVVLRDLHPCILAVVHELKNLRSQVTRQGIQTLGDMFSCLGRHMDADLDLTVRSLLQKSSDTSQFIREDTEMALGRMVDAATPQRAVVALTAQGQASHRNMLIRLNCARSLCLVCERMGPGRVLSGVKEVTDRILPAVGSFVSDGSPETRWFGRRMLYGLLAHQDFMKMCQRYIPNNTWRNVQDIIANLRAKGLGECPSSTPSAGMRRSESLTRGSSAGSLNGPDSSPSSSASKHRSAPGPVRRNEQAMEDAMRLVGQLNSSNWSVRHAAIAELLEQCENGPDGALRTQTTKVLDAFVLRLSDSNSKVNLYALQALEQMLPVLRELPLGPVLSVMVQHTAGNLSSKNQEIARTASRLLNAFMEHLDTISLVQPYVQAVTSANSRIKPEMVNKLTELTDRVCPRKPKLVTLHVLPELWRLLNSLTGTTMVAGSRMAVQGLVAVLFEHMHDELMECARTHVNTTPRMLQLLSDLIDNIGRGG